MIEDIYNELQKRKIKTVGELIEKLQKIPPETTFDISDADLGGYDISTANYIAIYYDVANKIIRFGHLEYEAWETYQKGLITHEEFEEIIKQ